MSDEVLGAEAPDHPVAAAYEEAALDVLRRRFIEHPRQVFFARQLEVLHEAQFFHWVTKRAVASLVEEGLVVGEEAPLAYGGGLRLLWHRSHRYPRREAKALVGLVDEYAAPAVGSALGSHAELLVVEGFALNQFVLHGRETREFAGQVWTETGHDLDMIVSRDGIAYGVEVKNSLAYMDRAELLVKTRLALAIGLRPVFVVRMMPKSWIWDVKQAGGFVLVMKYQLYPPVLKNLARKVQGTFGLPVDAPRSLQAGTMQRFVAWHLQNL